MAKSPLPLVAVAAFSAVFFWSLKPVFVTLVGDRATYAEVFIVAGLISTGTSLVVSLFLSRDVKQLVKNPASWAGLQNAVICGFFLCLWYYGFYRALYNSQKADVTIIAFTWPLIAVLAIRIILPDHGRKLTSQEWLLVIVAFLGAAAIGMGRISYLSLTNDGEIGFAFLAAFAGGMYLPFALKSLAVFEKVLGSKVKATFFSVSLANTTALCLALLFFEMTDYPLRFYAFDGYTILVCGMIGIGTYLIAEMTWTWALYQYRSLTLSSIVYFSPALSVFYLYTFFDVPVSSLSAFGMMLILFANMTLHGGRHLNNAVVSSLIGTLFIGLCSFFLRPIEVPFLTDILYYLSGLFAILAGFVLARVSSRRAQELDQRALTVRGLLNLRDDNVPANVDVIDDVLQRMIDIEFEESLPAKNEISLATKKTLETIRQAGNQSAKLAQERLDHWFNIHRDRLSLGEKAAIWIVGGASIFFLLLIRGDDLFSHIGTYAFSAGVLLVIFTISDYERSNMQGFRRHFLNTQDGFSEIGRPPYLPLVLAQTNESTGLPSGSQIRVARADGTIESGTISRERSYFTEIYWASTLFLIASLLALPISTGRFSELEFQRIVRPNPAEPTFFNPLGNQDNALTIGTFDWDASQVIARILKQTIEQELEVPVQITPAKIDEIFEGMAVENGKYDVHPDFWSQNQQENLEKYVRRSGKVRLNVEPYTGEQGLFLPTSQANALEIASISDLKSAELATKFDQDGDGLGEIWIGAREWKSTEAMRELLKERGMLDTWEPEVFSDRIFKAKLETFINGNKPIVFYGYAPDWIHDEFDLTRLNGPIFSTTTDCPNVNKARQDDVEGSPSNCLFQPIDVHVAFATRLEIERPNVAKLLSNVSFTGDEISRWISLTARKGQSPEEVASSWLKNNRARVDTWTAGTVLVKEN